MNLILLALCLTLSGCCRIAEATLGGLNAGSSVCGEKSEPKTEVYAEKREPDTDMKLLDSDYNVFYTK